jgi:hypothetical protein
MEVRIIFKRLMPSDERILEMKIDERSSPQLLLIENNVWNHHIMILKQAFMIAVKLKVDPNP